MLFVIEGRADFLHHRISGFLAAVVTLSACCLQHCNEWGYMLIGLVTAVPCLVLPAVLEPQSDRRKPLHQRYWIKANVWIAIFSFVGNYLWTHYFYRLLGASYTFPSWRLNDVRSCLSLARCCLNAAAHQHGAGAGFHSWILMITMQKSRTTRCIASIRCLPFTACRQ